MEKLENNNKRLRFDSYTTTSSALVFIMAIFLPSLVTSIFALIVGKDNFTSNAVFYYIALALVQLTFFGIYYCYNKVGKYNAKKCSKINFNLDYKQILVIILIGLVAVFSFSPLITLFQAVLKELGHTSSTSSLVITNFGYFLLNVLIVGIMPAIFEELIFRGVILNGYSKYKNWVMILLSSLMFMIMHLSIDQSIYQLFLGILLAVVVIKTGSIISSMILHFTNNIVILFSNYLYNINGVNVQVDYNFTPFNCIYPILVAIVGVVACVFLVKLLDYLTKKKNKTNDAINTNENETNSQINNKQNLKPNVIKGLNQGYSDAFWISFPLIVGIITWIVSVI